jgi:phenylpropionate dioxygenase-like ring-hydroxylating dioxygenase large terminal subunit
MAIVDRTSTHALVPTFQDLLAANSHGAVPAHLRETHPVDFGTTPVSIDRYRSKDFHAREMEKVWKRTWQMVCLEQEIAGVGDYLTYEIGDMSIVVVRSGPHEFHAFHNACLHRSNALCDGSGTTSQFRCGYHGWTYDLRGTLRDVPAAWDFPQIDVGTSALPRVRVETWDGLVFINMDDNAPSLANYMAPLAAHFEAWPWKQCASVAHVAKVAPCNWKTTLEATLEVYHVPTLHPQVFATNQWYEGQCDILSEHLNRLCTPALAPTGLTGTDVTEQELADLFCEASGLPPISVPDGTTARAIVAAAMREMLSGSSASSASSLDLSEKSDSEVLDGYVYTLFPNVQFFAAYGFPAIFKVRPNGSDPSSSIFEVWIFAPFGEGDELPAPAALRFLGPDEGFASVPEVGVGPILDQDMSSFASMGRGIRANQTGVVNPSRVMESRIRHFHATLEKYLAAP